MVCPRIFCHPGDISTLIADIGASHTGCKKGSLQHLDQLYSCDGIASALKADHFRATNYEVVSNNGDKMRIRSGAFYFPDLLCRLVNRSHSWLNSMLHEEEKAYGQFTFCRFLAFLQAIIFALISVMHAWSCLLVLVPSVFTGYSITHYP